MFSALTAGLAFLRRDSYCTTLAVQSGDSCASLAQRCGISPADFTTYNAGNAGLCSTLAVGEHVCCSAGSLPSFSPSPIPDGSCATHMVTKGDDCSSIAANYSLTVTQLSSYNNNTWGWSGCAALQAGQVICLSSGSPPMPASIPSAICGPQVNNTAKPADMSTLSGLNPCPLNACCDIWGQCGTTDEFCTATNSATGAPGTAAPNTNGCISNCGTAIINNQNPPAEFRRVGYFEAWNIDRPCLTMVPADINTTKYTHIHFSFGAIDAGTYAVNVSGVDDSFEQFVQLQGVKRILSFGGWAFSTNQATYSIFREAVSPSNYETFATNVVNFAVQNSLDGVDFDWEYPGALDIPGIPASSVVDSLGYLNFLQTLRKLLPANMTISVAAPASYWYLKGFPIEQIAKTIDYFVFMTYDLHGQWDYGNTFADTHCPKGGCLRSHVNLTETLDALAMITKAGVPANQVVVGVASYGRSFQMTQAGCTGPLCTFTGPQSGATPGKCTNTSGYLANAEIVNILATDSTATTYYDIPSDSNIMVWDNTQWVAYMDNETLASRISFYESKNLGGWVEWAIDLESFGEENDDNNCTLTKSCVTIEFPDCTASYKTLDALNRDADNIPDYCFDAYQIAVLNETMMTAFTNYSKLIKHGYESKFKTYEKYIKHSVPGSLKKFMNKHANTYFSCTVEDKHHNLVHGKCPKVPPSGRGSFTFTNETGFYAALAESYGIDKSWLYIGDEKEFTGVPQALDNFTVPDPKDIIASALSNFSTIADMLWDAAENSKGVYYVSDTDNGNSSMGDTVQGAALPVFMMQSAILAMDNVDEVAHKIDEARIKEIILGFIGAVLLLLPGIGEELAGADSALIASMGRLIGLAADGGNVAFDTYNTVQDPSNAIFAVFDGLSVAKSFGKAADAFRDIKAADLASLGNTVKDGTAKVQKTCLTCI